MSSQNEEYEKNSEFIPTKELQKFLQKKHYEQAKLDRKKKRLEEKANKRSEKLNKRSARDQELWNALKKGSSLEDQE